MFESFIASLVRWNETTDSRVKLQHTYAVAAIVLVIVAGVFGLVNYRIGQYLLTAAIVSATMFLFNGIAWALLQSVVVERLKSKKPVSKKK
ncbi:MAG: hypothetical protein ABIQ04_01960 [Candidatus Saccharimonadales bacterium]